MAHGTDTLERVHPIGRIDEVGVHVVRRRVGMSRWNAVHDDDVMPFADQEVDDVRPDEARSAGHEHPHAGVPRGVRTAWSCRGSHEPRR